jgi:Ca2+-transporting ATPase
MQKLRIVTALKHSGELVAVTGDGVNDVPALKAADIGIAMGERGSQSAKEVSSIILTDDNFSTIVNAIREGRQLFKNLTMSFEYLLLIHIPLVLAAAVVPLMGYPLVYLPIHIVWLEMIIHPTALLAFQAPASTTHKDSKSKKLFFSTPQIVVICITGIGLALLLGWRFLSSPSLGNDPSHARAIAVAILTLWSAGVTVHLTRLRSRVANTLAIATVLSSVVLIQWSGSLKSLHLTSLTISDWAYACLIVLGGLAALELLRWRNSSRPVD